MQAGFRRMLLVASLIAGMGWWSSAVAGPLAGDVFTPLQENIWSAIVEVNTSGRALIGFLAMNRLLGPIWQINGS
jgi:hypothetical protein